MGAISKFKDGLTSFVSSLVNQRNVTNQNSITAARLTDVEMREIYRTGLGNKIVRLKSGYALKDTLQFNSTEDKKYYEARLQSKVKEAARWAVAFGRGIIVLQMKGDDLSKPLGNIDPARVQIKTFSGDMVTVGRVEINLQSPRYYKPILYTVRGHPIHWSRVVDFLYVIPPELDSPLYKYGGISEFELIYEQLVADGVVQRASPRVIEKASTLFYKIKGFKEAMKMGQEADMVAYFGRLEDLRSAGVGAGLIDQEDELEVITQAITGLADADQITLRRLAMVTGIPLALLVGENVQGLNSTGDNERQAFQEMIETLQSDYLLDPINELMLKCEQGRVSFKENQGETPTVRIEYDGKAIENALKLWQMGEDYSLYLEEKGIIQPDDFSKIFSEPKDAPTLPAPADGEEITSNTEGAVDPTASLNGAQVTAILEVIARIRNGDLSKATAIEVVTTAFPLAHDEAVALLQDVQEGVSEP